MSQDNLENMEVKNEEELEQSTVDAEVEECGLNTDESESVESGESGEVFEDEVRDEGQIEGLEESSEVDEDEAEQEDALAEEADEDFGYDATDEDTVVVIGEDESEEGQNPEQDSEEQEDECEDGTVEVEDGEDREDDADEQVSEESGQRAEESDEDEDDDDEDDEEEDIEDEGEIEATVESVIESVLFASDEPLKTARLAKIAEIQVKPLRGHIRALNKKYREGNHSFRIERIAGGYQMMTLSVYNHWLSKLIRVRGDNKLSPAALETLAIIAYKQPIIRADIEAIRGVGTGEMIRSLMYKGLVRIAGRAEVLGRPMMYGTTKKFLQVFGLDTLKDLPKIEELKRPGN